MPYFEFLLKGYLILILAIAFNFMTGIFKIKNWYYYLNNINNPKLKVIDTIFLFIIYPMYLGLVVFIVNFLFQD
jgi:hypothetical protein